MSVLDTLIEERDKKMADVTAIAGTDAEPRDDISTEEETRAKDLLQEVDALEERIVEEHRKTERAKVIAEARSRVTPPEHVDVQVVDEPAVYGPDSGNSYYADQVQVQSRSPFDPMHRIAAERLATWEHQVEREVASRSKAGRAAEKQLREIFRPAKPEEAAAKMFETRERGHLAQDQKEQRAVTTGGGATASASGGGGAALVSPFIFADYVPYREYGRAFTDQCNAQDLPQYGMNVYMPQITSKAGIAKQTNEGDAVNETDPAAGYITSSLITLAGEVTVSQQLLDRSGPGFSYDRMVFDQLNRDYALQLDTYVLTQALAGATTQNWSGNTGAFVLAVTSGSGGFTGQVSKAIASVRTTAGTVLNPTHLFLRPDRWEYIQAWSDANGRPVVVPNYAGPWNAAAAGSSDGDSGIEGNTGYRMNGLRAFADQNIPLNGTTAQDQAIVADLNEVYVYEGTPVTRVVFQTLAGNLQTLLQMYSYVTALVRYPTAVVAITGTGMGTITYTT